MQNRILTDFDLEYLFKHIFQINGLNKILYAGWMDATIVYCYNFAKKFTYYFRIIEIG